MRYEAEHQGHFFATQQHADLIKLVRAVNAPRRVLTAEEHQVHQPKLDLRSYLVGDNEAPASISRVLPPFGDAWLNDTLGDCGEAMALNGIQTFHSAAGTAIPPFANADAETLYEQVGGYDPTAPLVDGQNPTDQGTDNNVLVAKWKNPGVSCKADGSRHQIAASLFIDPADTNLTKLAIWEFVVNFRAYALPITAETQQGQWSVEGDGQTGDSAPGSYGYHDIAQQEYDAAAIHIKTWGLPWLVDWDFDTTYEVQGFVVVTREQLSLKGVSPAGVDWTALNADIAKLPSSNSSN
jgi:hypothetical protein